MMKMFVRNVERISLQQELVVMVIGEVNKMEEKTKHALIEVGRFCLLVSAVVSGVLMSKGNWLIGIPLGIIGVILYVFVLKKV